jgi:hypothetical protein
MEEDDRHDRKSVTSSEKVTARLAAISLATSLAVKRRHWRGEARTSPETGMARLAAASPV